MPPVLEISIMKDEKSRRQTSADGTSGRSHKEEVLDRGIMVERSHFVDVGGNCLMCRHRIWSVMALCQGLSSLDKTLSGSDNITITRKC